MLFILLCLIPYSVVSQLNFNFFFKTNFVFISSIFYGVFKHSSKHSYFYRAVSHSIDWQPVRGAPLRAPPPPPPPPPSPHYIIIFSLLWVCVHSQCLWDRRRSAVLSHTLGLSAVNDVFCQWTSVIARHVMLKNKQ